MMELGKQLRPFTHLGPMRLKPHSFNKKVVLDFYTVIQKSK